jgi:HAD superfamily hydrolase (TIGR01509 family)
MPPKFIYFDLGRVLVDFDAADMCRRVARVAGITPDRVRDVIFDNGLQSRYELGQMSTREFYQAFCQRTRTRPDFDALMLAASDIFELIPSMVPVVQTIHRAGRRLGLLSNTCEAHFEMCRRKFEHVLGLFEVYALSYEMKVSKPEPAIYLGAAELAGVRPEDIFFTDDIPAHVAGAREVGFDAVQYTSTPDLLAELSARGVELEVTEARSD